MLVTNIYKYICINYSRHVRKWHLCFEGIFEDIFGWRPDGLHILKWKAMNFYFFGVYSDHLEFTWETLLSERPSIHPVSFILRKLLGTSHAWTTFNLPTRAQESVLHCSSLCIESDESMLENVRIIHRGSTLTANCTNCHQRRRKMRTAFKSHNLWDSQKVKDDMHLTCYLWYLKTVNKQWILYTSVAESHVKGVSLSLTIHPLELDRCN